MSNPISGIFSRSVSIGLGLAIWILVGAAPAQSQWGIVTYAGNGSASFSGDNGPALGAAMNNPRGMAIDAGGNLYIADSKNFRVRRVAANGTITTFAGNGISGSQGDGSQAVNASLSDVQGVAADSNGNIYIADSGNHRVRKVSASGVITTVVGTGAQGFAGDGGPAASAQLNRPTALAFDSSGNLYIADSSNQRIRKVTGGTITTIAGNGVAAYTGDGGQATFASLNFPLAVAVDRQGNLYIADAGNNVVRRVTGTSISTAAGTGVASYSGDGGSATSAALNLPYGVAVDGSGNIFITDSENNRVREVTGNTINTIAGNSNSGFSGDGGPATSATLSFPWAVTVDSAGNLFVADMGNGRVRKVYTGNASGPPPVTGTPQVGSATPATGTGNATFSFMFSDVAGYQNLNVVNILVNNFLNGAGACYLAYSVPQNVLYLVNDAGNALLPGLVLNGAGATNNSQCTITGGGSSATGSGTTLTLNLNISFSGSFGGNKVIYMAARDGNGGNSNWQALGTWSVPMTTPAGPSVVSVSPARSTGSGAITITATVNDTNGTQDIGIVNILINDALNGVNACYLAYSRTANTVYLVGDNGGSLQGGLTVGGSTPVSNSQCTLTGAFVSTSGTTTQVAVGLNFSPGFVGNRLIYVAARSNGDVANSGWQAVGSRTFQ